MRREALLLALLLATSAASSTDWPDVPLPDDAAPEWVSRHMLYNGLPMRASRFTTAGKREEVIDFYRKRWGTQMVQDQLGGKTILGRLDGEHYLTVELESAGAATQGTVGVMRLPKEPPREPAGHGFAKPAGSEVVNDIRYLDTRNETRTLVLTNALSPYVNQQFYVQRLRAQGWEIHDSGGCKSFSNACSARFEKKGGARMTMTIDRGRDGGSVVVANLE